MATAARRCRIRVAAVRSGLLPARGANTRLDVYLPVRALPAPVGFHDGQTELLRHGLVAQFADSNPLVPSGSQRPAVAVIGLWGGALEGTNVRIATDATGRLTGALEW